MKRDFVINVSNQKDLIKEVNIWELIDDREEFVISHIKIHCSWFHFYYENTITLGEKTYMLQNYLTQDNSCCLIYDFSRHYLAPLNILVRESDKWIVKVPALTGVNVSVSVS